MITRLRLPLFFPEVSHNYPLAIERNQQRSNKNTVGAFQSGIRKLIQVMSYTPLTTIVFSPKNDAGFRTFQKVVTTLLPGAMSIRGVPTKDEDGKYIFKIQEIRDSSNKIIWTRPIDNHGQLEDLLLLWERRIFKMHDLSIRRL